MDTSEVLAWRRATIEDKLDEEVAAMESALALEREKVKVLREAVEFYEDKDNWDDDQFSPTIWDNGKIDMGDRAREALAKIEALERNHAIPRGKEK